MFKTLLKKQMLEFFSAFFIDRKTGKQRSKNGAIGYGILYVGLFVMLGSTFFKTATSLCIPLNEMGFAWLYFALMSLMSIAVGIFGSVFNTYAVLYKAKDNDFLLSMPVQPRIILTARLAGTWIMGLVFECIVMIPTVLVYFINVKQSVLSVIFSLLLIVEISVVIIVLSCILGWLIAVLTNKMKNKNIVTVIASLVFLSAYYYVNIRATEYIKTIIVKVDEVSAVIKSYGYLLYQLGEASQGKILPMLIVTAVNGAAFAAVLAVISKSFIKLTTTTVSENKIEYKEKNTKMQSAFTALLKKEIGKFLSSPNYMLNCGLGTLIMPAMGIISLFTGEKLLQSIVSNAPDMADIVPMVAVAAICMAVSMNDITAPSISLEGKNIWIIQSYPVDMKAVLNAKLLMHFLFTAAPALICGTCLSVALKLSVVDTVAVCIMSVVFVYLNGVFGLFMNLKKPNMTWTNEIVPIKQSSSVMVTIFASWGVIIILGLIYFLLGSFIPHTVFLYICIALVVLAAVGIHKWLNKTGSEILKSL